MKRHNVTSLFGCVAGGTFLLLAMGCAESRHSDPVSFEAPLTVPVPTLDQFVLLASRSVTLGDRTQVTGGDIGVAPGTNAQPSTLTAGIDSRIAIGEVLLAQRVVLRDRAIAGEIGANQIQAPLATSGPRSAYVAPPALPVPGTFTAGNTPVNVTSGQTTALAPGRYGAVTVSGTLNLSGGLYEIQSLRVNPTAGVVARAATTLHVTGGVFLTDDSRLVHGPGLRPGDLRVLVAGNVEPNVSLSAAPDVELRALVVARNIFRAADRLNLTGSVAALEIVVGNDARVAFASGFSCATNAACNDGSACTQDSCVDGRCVNQPATNGTACSDGNACTRSDSCQAGTCVGANPVVCSALDQCHDAGSCDPANGQCSNPVKPAGAACNDGSACTRVDSCQAGACVGADPVICTASDACHAPGTCDAATGACSNPAQPNGTACDDGNLCTRSDSCQAGSCLGADAVVCTAIDDCHDAGVCDASTGTCSSPAKPDGAACNDGNACTRADACALGSCVGADPVVCTALDQCHEPGACDPASGACSELAKPDGATCDDEDACTHGDRCDAGVCTAGTDLAVTEFDTGLSQPGWIVSGPLDSLWFLSPETFFGTNDASIAQITTAGVVTRNPLLFRNAYSLIHAPDGLLWIGETLLGGLPGIARYSATSGAVVTDFIGMQPYDMASSNDGGSTIIWFTGGSSVGRITPGGVVLQSVPTFSATRAITAAAPAPTTTIWFTEANTGLDRAYIGRLSFPNLVQFPIETPGELADITEGPDGGIWFIDAGNNEIGRLSPTGSSLDRFPLLTSGSGATAITAGPDGNLWTTLRIANKVARVDTEGSITEICIPTPDSSPTQITSGPDGNVWFTERSSGKIGRIQLSP